MILNYSSFFRHVPSKSAWTCILYTIPTVAEIDIDLD
jgi:hypothetical protein